MKKVFLLLSAACILVPLVTFLLFSPYYDLSGNWLYIPNQSSKHVTQFPIQMLRQNFFSSSENLSKINVAMRQTSATQLDISLIDNQSKEYIRRKENITAAGNLLLWEFEPLRDSKGKEYVLELTGHNTDQADIRVVFFIPYGLDDGSMGELKINNSVASSEKLAMHWESRFGSPIGKIQTFVARIQIHKAPAFSIFFFTLFVLFFFVLLPALCWFVFQSIMKGKK